MKTISWKFGMLLALALLASGGALRADEDEVQLTSNFDETGEVVSDSVAATYATNAAPVKPQPQPDGAVAAVDGKCSCCNQCGGQGCGKCGHGHHRRCHSCGRNGNCCNKCGGCNGCCNCCPWGPFSEPCPRIGLYAWSGVDAFRGVTTGRFGGNYGAVGGANAGGALYDPWDIGWQAGASYGGYNFSGNPSPTSQTNEITQQIFITAGIFRRANINRRLSWGIVHDWMIVDNFGVYGSSFDLGQFRGQAAWALSSLNEVGLWAAIQDQHDTKATGAPLAGIPGAPGTPVTYQAIDQGNVFWHRKFGQYGADGWFYAGIPLNGRIATPANSPGFPVGGAGGSIGTFIVGTNMLVPINNRLSMYGNVMYMKPSAHEGINAAGNVAAAQEFWNIGFGMAYYPGNAARSRTVAGRQWMPYLPVANNGTFMVDSTKTQ